jgi:hypothetical protein
VTGSGKFSAQSRSTLRRALPHQVPRLLCDLRGQLRRARLEHRRAQRYTNGQLDPWGRPVDESTVLFLGSWSYAGTGYGTSDGHTLALMSADSARGH